MLQSYNGAVINNGAVKNFITVKVNTSILPPEHARQRLVTSTNIAQCTSL